MADGVPLSAEVTRALLRCALTSGTVGLWESLLLGAVKRYRSAVSVKGNTTTLGVSGMARRLDGPSLRCVFDLGRHHTKALKIWTWRMRLILRSYEMPLAQQSAGLGRSLVQNMGRQSERWCGMWHECTSTRQGRGLV